MSRYMPRIAILNNQIMPYRIPLFEALSRREVISPMVLFSSARGPDRQWDLRALGKSFPHEILQGFPIRLPKPHYNEQRTIWVNPTLFFDLFRLNPDAIIAYEYSVPTMTALLYSHLRNCPCLLWSEMTPHSERSLTRDQHWARRIIVPHADAFLGASLAACQNFIDKGIPPEKVHLAPQPFDQNAFRQTSHQPQHPWSVLYVGYLNERKGVIHLLHAFKLVLESLTEGNLTLVGDGILRQELESFALHLGIKQHVKFMGFLEPKELAATYSEYQVFVLPSLEDTFGVVAAEALGSGLSLVCSKYAGVSSHLNDGHDSYIVDPFDHRQMANRIVTLLKDEDQRAQFRVNSQKLLRTIAPNAIAERFEQAIHFALT